MFDNNIKHQLLTAIAHDLSLIGHINHYAFKLSADDFEGEEKQLFNVLLKKHKEGFDSVNIETLYNEGLDYFLGQTDNPKLDFQNAMDVYVKERAFESFKTVSQDIYQLMSQNSRVQDVSAIDKAIDSILEKANGYRKATGRWNSGSAMTILQEDYKYEEDGGRIPSYIPELDEVLSGGFYRAGNHVVSALPHNGKTTLAVQMATMQAVNGFKVLYLTLEQKRVDILENVLSVLSEKEVENRSYWEAGKIANLEDEAEKKNRARQLIDTYIFENLHIDDTPFEDEGAVLDRIRYAVDVEGFDIIYVDNFQNVNIHDNKTPRFEKLADEMLNISRASRVPIVNLSQLTADAKGNLKTKHCAKVNENAVTNLHIYREKPSQNEEEEQAPDCDMIYIHILKNRKGKGFLAEDLAFAFLADKSVIGSINLPTLTPDEMFIKSHEADAIRNDYQECEGVPF